MAAPRQTAARRPTRVSKSSMQNGTNGELPSSGVRRSKRILELQGGTDLPDAQSKQPPRRLQKTAQNQETSTPPPAKRRKLSPRPNRKKAENGQPVEQLPNPASSSLPQKPQDPRKISPKEESQKPSSTLQPSVLPGVQFADPATTGLGAFRFNHISHWASEGHVWPQTFLKEDPMFKFIAKRRPSGGLSSRKRSGSSCASTITPSEPLGDKSAAYKSATYESLLETEGNSFMDCHKRGITDESDAVCQQLLESKQSIPENTIFRDDIFFETCQKLRGKNEARIVKDCTPLIAPGAEGHALITRNEKLDILIESVNEGWNKCVPITKPRPQPDYAVGFRRSSFTDEQLKRLEIWVGELTASSYFMATWYMYFPFFTCEVKCGVTGLDIADRQNQHSMTVAMRAMVELFRVSNRAEELNREVIAFSISHDHQCVRIYGHFPVIEPHKTTYWRFPLRKYDFTERRGFDKWAALTFVKNIYDNWAPGHFKRLCSAIDTLPLDIPDFELSQSTSSAPSKLSQCIAQEDFEDFNLNKSPAAALNTPAPEYEGSSLKRVKTSIY